MMMVVCLHIADRINTDQTADKSRNDRHEHRQTIHLHMAGRLDRKICFCPNQHRRLRNGEQNHRILPVHDAQIDNQRHKHKLSRQHQMIDQFGFPVEAHDLAARNKPLRKQGDRQRHHAAGSHIHENRTDALRFEEGNDHRNEYGPTDQEWYDSHKHPPSLPQMDALSAAKAANRTLCTLRENRRKAPGPEDSGGALHLVRRGYR